MHHSSTCLYFPHPVLYPETGRAVLLTIEDHPGAPFFVSQFPALTIAAGGFSIPSLSKDQPVARRDVQGLTDRSKLMEWRPLHPPLLLWNRNSPTPLSIHGRNSTIPLSGGSKYVVPSTKFFSAKRLQKNALGGCFKVDDPRGDEGMGIGWVRIPPPGRGG